MATKHNHFQRGQSPTFICMTCGRRTRDTGQGVDHLCEQCFDLAGLDNEVNDSGLKINKSQAAYRDKLLATIARKGGDVEKVKSFNTFLWRK